MMAFPTREALSEATPADLGLVALRGLIEIEDQQRARLAHPLMVRFTLTRQALQDDILNGITGQHDAPIAAEAVAWLMAHGLIAELVQQGSPSEVVFATNLGREMALNAQTTAAGVAMTLRVVELLPIAIRQKVTSPLLSGDFDLAVAAAYKAVEIRMRERANLTTHDCGSRLLRKFFELASGTSLARPDRAGTTDERHLFESVFSLYRNRAMHELPHIDSAEYALEVIIAAAHLLRIVEAANLTPATNGAAGASTP